MNVPEKHRALAHAWVDGALVEVSDGDGGWYLITNPAWSERSAYRIKPKPKVKKWYWSHRCCGRTLTFTHYYTESEAAALFGKDCVKLPWTEIEVEEKP